RTGCGSLCACPPVGASRPPSNLALVKDTGKKFSTERSTILSSPDLSGVWREAEALMLGFNEMRTRPGAGSVVCPSSVGTGGTPGGICAFERIGAGGAIGGGLPCPRLAMDGNWLFAGSLFGDADC